jgi:hypothetical protein
MLYGLLDQSETIINDWLGELAVVDEIKQPVYKKINKDLINIDQGPAFTQGSIRVYT